MKSDWVVYSFWVRTMKPLKTKISITLDDPVLEQVKKLAEQEDRSLSSYVNLVLRAHLEGLERQKQG